MQTTYEKLQRCFFATIARMYEYRNRPKKPIQKKLYEYKMCSNRKCMKRLQRKVLIHPAWVATESYMLCPKCYTEALRKRSEKKESDRKCQLINCRKLYKKSNLINPEWATDKKYLICRECYERIKKEGHR